MNDSEKSTHSADIDLKNHDHINIFDYLEPGHKLVFRQNDPLMPQHPFRMISVGATGAGKTQRIMNNVCFQDFKWDHVYLYAADCWEEKYEQFMHYMLDIANDAGVELDDILTVGSKPEHIIPLDDLDRDRQNLIIIDDFANEKKANETIIADYFIRSRKLNCSIMYLTQYYYAVPKKVRMQAGYFMLFKPKNNVDKSLIATELCDTDIEPKDLKAMYDRATSEPFGFLFIDTVTRDPKLKYRIGFKKSIQMRRNNTDDNSEE